MPNDFYNASGYPGPGSAGSSASLRNEFSQIAQAFARFPALSGSAGRVLRVGAGGTGIESIDVADLGAVARAGDTMTGLLTLSAGLTVSTGATSLRTLSAAQGVTFATTLAVTGLSTLQTLSVPGAANLGSTLAVAGVTTLASATVTGATALGSTASVAGLLTLASGLTVTAGATTLQALTAQAASFTTLAASAAATLGSTLSVAQGATLSSTLAVTGTSGFTGAVTMAGALTLNNIATVNGSVTIRDNDIYRTGASGGLYFSSAQQMLKLEAIGAASGLQLAANGAVHLTLGADGNFGIGGSTLAVAKFNVTGTSVFGRTNNDAARLYGGAAFMSFWDAAGTTRASYVQGVAGGDLNIMAESAAGRVTIGTNGSQRLKVAANGVATDKDDQELGWKDTPRLLHSGGALTLNATHRARTIQVDAGSVTIDTASPGATYIIMNNTGAAMTVTQGTSSMRMAGTASTGTRSLAVNGLASVMFLDATTCMISGAGLS